MLLCHQCGSSDNRKQWIRKKGLLSQRGKRQIFSKNKFRQFFFMAAFRPTSSDQKARATSSNSTDFGPKWADSPQLWQQQASYLRNSIHRRIRSSRQRSENNIHSSVTELGCFSCEKSINSSWLLLRLEKTGQVN